MSLTIDDTNVCPHCGGYFQGNGHCSNGHLKRLVPIDSFEALGAVENPFPDFLDLTVSGPVDGVVRSRLAAKSGAEILMEPYEPTDTEGHANEAVGILRDDSRAVPFHAYYSVHQGDSLTPHAYGDADARS